MSNRLFQSVIHQMKDAVDRVIGVIDENGVIISCSELVKIGEIRQGIRDELAYASDIVVSGGYTYRPISTGNKTEYIVFVEGDDKALEAVKMAVESPLLETTIHGASHVIINVSGDITLADASDAAGYVQDLAGDDVNIIFGAMYDSSKADSCTITVIATGLEDAPAAPVNRTGNTYKPMTHITPNSLKGVNTQNGATNNVQAAAPVAEGPKTVSGIKKPVDIRSSVEEKTLKIPDFLQKK